MQSIFNRQHQQFSLSRDSRKLQCPQRRHSSQTSCNRWAISIWVARPRKLSYRWKIWRGRLEITRRSRDRSNRFRVVYQNSISTSSRWKVQRSADIRWLQWRRTILSHHLVLSYLIPSIITIIFKGRLKHLCNRSRLSTTRIIWIANRTWWRVTIVVPTTIVLLLHFSSSLHFNPSCQ